MSEYKVALDVYNGPLDLLLFLIRREEVDIYDIPIARITQQYIDYVQLLEQIDPEVVSEFLVLAATLMEIKSRMLLPKPPPEEVDEEMIDPRSELVRQLLEYKKFKDAARSLEDAAELRSQRHARSPVLPETPADELELENLDIWDLFSAFNKLLQQIGKLGAVHKVGVDDTPIALHAADIMDSIERAGGTQVFEEVFMGRSRAEMIGLFLALLELIRQHRVRATQDRPFGAILLVLLDATPLYAVKEPEEVEGEEAAVDDSEVEAQFRDRLGPEEDEDDADAPKRSSFDEPDFVGRAMPADATDDDGDQDADGASAGDAFDAETDDEREDRL